MLCGLACMSHAHLRPEINQYKSTGIGIDQDVMGLAAGSENISPLANRDVTEPAKICFHRIWILQFKSVRYGFVTRSQVS